MTALPAQLANVSAECSVLSAAVYREDWLLDILSRVTVHDFTRSETAAIFDVIAKMHQRGEKVTLETLWLHNKELNDAGFVMGRDMTFSEMVNNPPAPHELSGFIDTLKSHSRKGVTFIIQCRSQIS